MHGDGGAADGLTNNPSILRWWTVPEVVKLIKEFQNATEPESRSQDTKHHDH